MKFLRLFLPCVLIFLIIPRAAFAGVAPEDELGRCRNGNHILRRVRVTAVRHCFFDTDPRCLECNYRITYCLREGCDYYEEFFDGPGAVKRISCHSGTRLKAWEIYDNYLNYGSGERKISGYTTESVTVNLTRNFALRHDTLSTADFPDIAERIISLEYSKDDESALIRFGEESEKLSSAEIDRYIAALKYLESLYYVYEVVPDYKTEKYEPPSTDTERTETTAEEPSGTAPDGEDTTSPPDTVPAPESDTLPPGGNGAPESAADGAKESAGEDGGAPHNPPTGDVIYLLFSLALISLFTAAVTIWLRFKKRK